MMMMTRAVRMLTTSLACLVMPGLLTFLHASPSALERPSLKRILEGQDWDSIQDWQQKEEQAESMASFGDWEAAYRIYGQAADILNSRRGSVHPLTLRLRSAQAHAMIYLGKLESGERQLQEILRIQESRLGEDHADALMTQHRLATAMLVKGQVKEAGETYLHLTQKRSRTLGKAHEDTLASQINYAIVLGMLNNHADAEIQWREVLKHETELYGERDFNVLNTRSSLAQCLQQQSKFEEALSEFRAVFALQRKEHGPRHELTLQSWHAVAETLSQQGKSKEAEQEYQALVDFMETLVGTDEPSTFPFKQEIALLQQNQGHLITAEKGFRHLLKLKIEIYGEDHEVVGAARLMLAYSLLLQNKGSDSAALSQQVLETRKKSLGPTHPLTLFARKAVLDARFMQGHFKELEVEYRELLTDCESVYGTESSSTWQVREALATVLRRLNRAQESLQLLQTIAEAYEASLGPLHPSTLRVKSNISETYAELGRIHESKATQREVYEMQKQRLGPTHPDTLKSSVAVAMQFATNGQVEEAEELFRFILPVLKEEVHANHALLLMTERGLALVLQLKGEYEEAEKLSHQAFERAKVFPGIINPNTIYIGYEHASVLWRLNKHIEALKLLDTLLTFSHQIFGKDQGASVLITSRRAMALSALDRAKEAEQAFAEVEALLRSQHGENSLVFFEHRTSRAYNMAKLGKVKIAEQRLANTLQDMRLIFPRESIVIQNAENHLRDVLQQQGVKVAPNILPDLVAGSRSDRTHLPENFQTSKLTSQQISKLDEASAYSSQQNFKDAEHIFRELLRDIQINEPNESFKIAWMRLNIVKSCLYQNKKNAAWLELDEVATLMRKMPPYDTARLERALFEMQAQLEFQVNMQITQEMWAVMAKSLAKKFTPSDPLLVNARLQAVIQKVRSGNKTSVDELSELCTEIEGLLGRSHRITLQSKLVCAEYLGNHGKPHDADAMLDPLKQAIKDVFGEYSPEDFTCRMTLAVNMSQRGMHALAIMEMRVVCAEVANDLGEDSILHLRTLERLLFMLNLSERFAEAEQVCLKIIAVLKASRMVEPFRIHAFEMELALCLARQQKFKASYDLAKTAQQSLLESLGPDHPLVKNATDILQKVQLDLRNFGDSKKS